MSAQALAPGARPRAFFAGVDPVLAVAAGALLALGLLLPLAASADASAEAPFALAIKQAAAAGLAVLVGLAAASASPLLVRRAGLILLGIGWALLIVVAVSGADVKGASRWLKFGGFSFQPTEIVKPALVVCAAWMLAERMRRADFPGGRIVLAGFALTAGLLLAQPDLGQTVLIGTVLVLTAAAAGLKLWAIAAAGGAGAGLLAGAYVGLPHVRPRIEAFLDPSGPGGYQARQAKEAIASGGLLGRGPGEGVVKERLPDAHSDFVFAVAGEEFGFALTALLIGLYAALVWSSLRRASALVDPFAQLAATGLAGLLALQAGLHIAVNLSLLPAKGITLPLVSYGGSSLIGSALAIGFLAALTRARAGAFLYDRTP